MLCYAYNTLSIFLIGLFTLIRNLQTAPETFVQFTLQAKNCKRISLQLKRAKRKSKLITAHLRKRKQLNALILFLIELGEGEREKD